MISLEWFIKFQKRRGLNYYLFFSIVIKITFLFINYITLLNYQISQNLLEKVNKDYDLLKLKATDSETISLKTNEQLKENVIPFFIVDRQVNENSKFIL